MLKKIFIYNFQQNRWLPRWNSRRPVRVIPAEEYDEKTNSFSKKPYNMVFKNEVLAEQTKISQKINWKQPITRSMLENSQILDKPIEYNLKTKKSSAPLTISKTSQSKTTQDMLETIIDADGNFIYTKMKNKDTRISSILINLKSKKEMEKRSLIILEGKRLIKDALDAGCKLEYLLFSRMNEVEYLKPYLPKLGAKLYKMPYREIQLWSDLNTPPGIMGIFKLPDIENYISSMDTLPLTVICDNIREPNNLGAILRTSLGAGCEKVLLTKGCVNLWDSKVLRSASGAHFKLHIQRKLTWDDIKEKINPNSTIYVADNRMVTTVSNNEIETENLTHMLQAVPVVPYYGVDYGRAEHVVLVIGGETEGLSEDSYKLVADMKGARLNVPLSNNVDSLNTGSALAVILFEMKRQLSRISDCKN